MIEAGQPAPDFTAPDQSGRAVRLADLLAESAVVLFFYPRALTTGCTAESCHFRDLTADLATAGARPVGISADPVERQARFDERNHLGFPLLSDADRRIAAAYGVRRPGPLFNRRATFVIGRDGTVLGTVHSELRMDLHADRALEILRSSTIPGPGPA